MVGMGYAWCMVYVHEGRRVGLIFYDIIWPYFYDFTVIEIWADEPKENIQPQKMKLATLIDFL